jgi:hypothetical protein
MCQVMTGGIGREEIRAFYAERFIPQMPQDAEIDLVSRTVRSNTVVDEFSKARTRALCTFFCQYRTYGKAHRGGRM